MEINVGLRLKKVREVLGLKQNEFARRIAVPASSISKIEKGAQPLSESVALLIEFSFGVRKNWLLRGEGQMFIDPARVEKLEGFNSVNTNAQKVEEASYYEVAPNYSLVVEVIPIVEDLLRGEGVDLPSEKKGNLIVFVCREISIDASFKKNLRDRVLRLIKLLVS